MSNDQGRLCRECRQPIPAARLKVVPGATLCVDCKKGADDDSSPRIDEGLAGTREDHKRMRGKQWGEMIQRFRGK